MAEPREFTIELPPGLPLLSLNDRKHWAARNAATRRLKEAAWAMALKARSSPEFVARPMDRAVITVEYQPPDRRRRDPDNLAPAGKALIDGLVAAKVLPDDDGKHVAAVRYVIGPLYPLHPRGRVILHVREIGEQEP